MIFRRKVHQEGRFGSLFNKIAKQYVQINNEGEAKKDPTDPNHDDVKAESLGRRVVYDNFSTIGKNMERTRMNRFHFYYLDWIFDQTKERIRWKKIHALKGWKGKVVMFWDDISSWIAVIVVGNGIQTFFLVNFNRK